MDTRQKSVNRWMNHCIKNHSPFKLWFCIPTKITSLLQDIFYCLCCPIIFCATCYKLRSHGIDLILNNLGRLDQRLGGLTLTFSLLLEVLELLKLSEPIGTHFSATLDLVLHSLQLSIAEISRPGIRSELPELIQ